MKSTACKIGAALMLMSLTACSKKDAPNNAPAVAPETTATTPAQPTATPMAPASGGQLESRITTALQQQNYDLAVDSLAQVNPAAQNLTDAQRLQYSQQLQNTMQALARAKETDPRAKAAYERLGRIATGR